MNVKPNQLVTISWGLCRNKFPNIRPWLLKRFLLPDKIRKISTVNLYIDLYTFKMQISWVDPLWGYSNPLKLVFRISLSVVRWWVGCAFGYQVGRKSNSASNLLLFVFGHTHPSQLKINSATGWFSTKLIRVKSKREVGFGCGHKSAFRWIWWDPPGRLAGARWAEDLYLSLSHHSLIIWP